MKMPMKGLVGRWSFFLNWCFHVGSERYRIETFIEEFETPLGAFYIKCAISPFRICTLKKG